MTVVSNTSPLNYLVLIELDHLLPALFDRILIPAAVHQELGSPKAPAAVRNWIGNAPGWLEVRTVSEISSSLLQLDAGEREAIALAQAAEAKLVLLDERKARAVARAQGLAVSGTLGVLDTAATQRQVVMTEALERLQRSTFRASPRLLRRLREKHSS